MSILGSQLSELLHVSKSSPEEFGARMGISGMTLRRWIKSHANKPLDSSYNSQMQKAVYELIAEDRISQDNPIAQLVIDLEPPAHLKASLHTLFGNMQTKAPDSEDAWISALHQIGTRTQHVQAVDKMSAKSWKRFFTFGAMKTKRIEKMLSVIKDKNLPSVTKGVAYGALFYLLTPFDLIPDNIPGIGFLDDFGALELAASYYLNHLRPSKT